MVDSDDDITRLAHDLGNVLRRTLAGSAEVSRCLERIKSRGYELSVVLEATVAFTPAEPAPPHDVQGAPPEREILEAPQVKGGHKMTPLDRKFLRSLKISVDEDD
jgi:hypothetical protein